MTNTAEQHPHFWNEKRYYSFDYYLRETFGEKLYKVALNGGMTCPNRDGTVGTRGCIFCSEDGSGDFAGSSTASITDQLSKGKADLRSKRPISSFIAYFQAYTNTYADLDYLRQIYMEAISDPDVKVLSIATRPDCLGEDVLALLDEMNHIKPVWIELGLQTIHEDTAAFIRRGYDLSVFEQALSDLNKIHIPVIVHTILGLPGESKARILETIAYLNNCNISGIKLQLLHVLKDTDLAVIYQKQPFWIPTMEEYVELICTCLTHLRHDIVIHRITGDGPKDLLIAPLWSSSKRTVLNQIHSHLKQENLWQGKEREM